MNILLLDGGKAFGHSHGELNHTLHKKAKEVLTALGDNVKETVIDAGYDVEAEIEKFLWMDAVIWQMPSWNAPIEAFTREGDFFEGKGVDAVYMPFHKLNEFIGLTRLPTFLCNDVVKNPQVEQYLSDYQAHLEKVFG